MGAYRGRGKRAGFGVGGFLLGVPGKGGKYYSISNLGTGLSDEQFKTMNKVVEKLKTENKPEEYLVDATRTPDVWVSPKVVLEVLADEISVSPRHLAKYSLRFPRLIKIRDDKNPEQATSVKEVEKIYNMQNSAHR
jgi:DNA ligase-1